MQHFTIKNLNEITYKEFYEVLTWYLTENELMMYQDENFIKRLKNEILPRSSIFDSYSKSHVPVTYFYYYIKKELVGYLEFNPYDVKENLGIYIRQLVVNPNFRGKSIGSEIIRVFIKIISNNPVFSKNPITVKCEATKDSIEFWEKIGFKQIDNSYFMIKNLKTNNNE